MAVSGLLDSVCTCRRKEKGLMLGDPDVISSPSVD